MRGWTMGIAALALAAGVVAGLPIGAGAESTPEKAAASDGKSCSCKGCEQEVCCKAPTGFAPLDEKCKTLCTTKNWTVAKDADCGKGEGCCP